MINAFAANVSFEISLRSAAINAKRDHILGGKLHQSLLILRVRQERGKIDNDEIGFFASVECADDTDFPECTRTAMGGEIKCLARTKWPQIWFVGAARLLHFDRRAHHLPHI